MLLTDGTEDEGMIDLLRKTKSCLIRILNSPESKTLIAQLAIIEEEKAHNKGDEIVEKEEIP